MSKFNYDMVAFGAHPDDIEICCGGLLLLMAERGYRTGIVDLTQGELGTRGTPEIRSDEAARASKILCLSVRENLGLPDGSLSGYASLASSPPESTQVTKVVSALRRLRPENVLVPYDHERHPDHVAASVLLTRALYLAGLRRFPADSNEPYTPHQVMYFQMRYQFRPTFIVDITSVYEKKLEAIRCYASQFGLPHPEGSIGAKQGGKEEAHPTLLTSPQTHHSLGVRDRYFGAMIGVSYGEAYLTKNALSVVDPIKYFRENSVSTPLLFPEEL